VILRELAAEHVTNLIAEADDARRVHQARRAQRPAAFAPARRAELDLMRAFVVAGLVVFHSAEVFAVGTQWFVNDPRPNIGFSVFLLWGSLWGMPLLFLISGMAARHALRARTAGAFVRERLARLLVPFVIGLVVLVPPMFYLARLGSPGFHESYWRFWLRFIDPQAIAGGLLVHGSWSEFDPAHMWFLYVLLILSFLLLPVFVYVRRPQGTLLVARLAGFADRHAILAVFAAATPIVLVETAFGPDINTGGWERLAYLFPLLYGFLIASDARFGAACRRARLPALACAVAGTVVLVIRAGSLGESAANLSSGGVPALSALQGLAGWLWIVSILGFTESLMARRRSQSGTISHLPPVRAELRWRRATRYANEAVLPFYVLHEPVIVAAAWIIIRFDAPIVAKYAVLVTVSFTGTLLLYETLVRRFRVPRLLFGMKPASQRRGDRDRRPKPWRPERYRGSVGCGPDRCRHASSTGRFRRAAVPARHLLAAGWAGLAVLVRPSEAGLHMKPRTIFRAACVGLAVTLSACTSSSSHVPSQAGKQADRPSASIRVGSFDFPESVLLAEIYGQALAADGFPVRILPNLGPREVVDPALVHGLVQLVPEYAGSALEFFSLGKLAATSDAGAANRALAGSVAGRGLVAARPAPAQDANAVVVTAATAVRYGLRSIADLAKVAPGLMFGGPPECPGRAYCLPGLKRVYGLRFKAFSPLDAGGPLTLQALEAGYIGVALLFTTDPSIPARHLAVLADDRGLQPAENITPLVRRDVAARYGPRLLAILNKVSALLDTGTLRTLEARVELAGQDPRRVAGSWLRAHGLIPAGGDLR
jgi:glycine betaine/choline ABC-type transport system substrate-binding protein/surface polysaccharide O-acyltransferase-like enzyme